MVAFVVSVPLAALAALDAGGAPGAELSKGTVNPTATAICFPSRDTSIPAGVIFVTFAPAIEPFSGTTLLYSGCDPAKKANVSPSVTITPVSCT